jgi:hypothetical protein
MRRIRILLADLPPELQDWLRSRINLEPDLELVGHEHGIFRILALIGDTRPDIVVVMLPDTGSEPGSVSHILGEYSSIAVLAISRQMDHMAAFRYTITRNEFVPSRPDLIAPAIREAAAGLDR